jgi:epsilon-lactone hydrolase
MARYQFIVLSQAKPGREEEFVSWYRDQHLVDVSKQPGVVSARLYRTDYQKVYTIDAPRWCLLTIYELESEDPAATVEEIRSKSGLPEMPETDALDKTGMIIVVGHQIGEVT